MYSRTIGKILKNKFRIGKVIILIGARQVGKTTVIKEILKNKDFLFLDCDDIIVKNALSIASTEHIRNILGNYKTVFIDEAQRVENIGLTLKIIADQMKDIQVLVSGSSSFDLTSKINESLTGRKLEYEMFPVSWEELENKIGFLKAQQQLENRLLYGFYPDVLNNQGNEKEILKNIVSSYLYKDILSFTGMRKPEILEKLVQALALQIGSEVSYNELSQTIGIDKNTISRYIDILQKGYVVFKLGCYSNNTRDEIKTNKKIYFFDNGIRNMVIGNFTNLDLRQDKGALWENFLIAERIKQISYKSTFAKPFFWKNKQQQEVDYVELIDGKVSGFEFKWNDNNKYKFPNQFLDKYTPECKIIDTNNFREFVM